MKKTLLLLVITAAATVGLLSQTFTYVGAAKCAICHKTEKQGRQHPIWQESKHSQSIAALSCPQAAEVAQQANVQNPVESPDCLKCHAPLYEKAVELKAEGVTCEVCHGPGSEYKKLNIMKDPALAKQNGLIVYDSPEAVKKQCLTCHANAHGKSFDFATAVEKIKHNRPVE
ncbi:MAG TPA: multiheme c-type cytochrome [Candidatus Desulfaltia sp.]|nr:multiheme c-type cytochrome [Candidatus Desulfaltia sp.]